MRLFFPLPLSAPEQLRVEGERFHYLARVLRVREGDTLEVFDGHGHGYGARVAQLGEASLTLILAALPADEAPRPRPLTLLQGVPKGDAFDWLLQKTTELGVSALCPVLTDRSVVRVPPDKAEAKRQRWQRIVEEAARQCGRRDVPEVARAAPLLEAARSLAPGTRLLVLDEDERALRLMEAAGARGGEPLALVVGPEGGLSREEVAALRVLGGQCVTLGRLVLRTETAGLAALSILRHTEGLLG